MDIRSFAVEETRVLHLKSASDDPLIGDDGNPMTVTLYGPGSKQYARAQAAQNNRFVERLQKKGKAAEQTAEQSASERADRLAACTKEFSSNIAYDDLKGTELFKAVYSDPSIGFIAEQVGTFINDWGNFSKPSTEKPASTSSS